MRLSTHAPLPGQIFLSYTSPSGVRYTRPAAVAGDWWALPANHAPRVSRRRHEQAANLWARKGFGRLLAAEVAP